tara:strand:+ start:234 stop:962 length:729 start_codon:yes stop_codon:yes gene_type:complete
MPKFFRNIPQNVFSENKLINYLIYTISEILLVVIGILVALQIDNWNEQRKKETLELNLLKEMKSNLLSDIEDINENIRFHERGVESANIILRSFKNDYPYNDSLNKHYGKVPMIPKFLMSENAYNSMNNEGIRIISNDSLRNAITHHYESSSAFMMHWNEAEWETQMQDHRTIYRDYFKKFDFWSDLEPVNYTELSKNSQYINYLNNRIGWLKPTIRMYKGRIRGSEKLIALIDSEIVKREQ